MVTCLQEALLRGSVSDEDADEVSEEEADDAEEVSQDDEAELDDSEAEALPPDALLDERASDSEDEQEASEGLAHEDALEAGEDADSQPEAEEDDSADEQEVGEEEDGAGKEPVLDSTALSASLASRSKEETAEPEQEQRPESRADKRHKKRKVQSEDPDSLQSLKRQLTEAKRQASAAAAPEHDDTVTNADSAAAASPQVCCHPYNMCVLSCTQKSPSALKLRNDSAKTTVHACTMLLRLTYRVGL